MRLITIVAAVWCLVYQHEHCHYLANRFQTLNTPRVFGAAHCLVMLGVSCLTNNTTSETNSPTVMCDVLCVLHSPKDKVNVQFGHFTVICLDLHQITLLITPVMTLFSNVTLMSH